MSRGSRRRSVWMALPRTSADLPARARIASARVELGESICPKTCTATSWWAALPAGEDRPDRRDGADPR